MHGTQLIDTEARVAELEARLAEVERVRRRHGWRSRWAAIGAAIAVALGAGAVIQYATAAIPTDPNSFVPVTPFRVFDTRPLPDNVGGFVGPLTATASHTYTLAGEGSIPDDAVAVVMNVTVILPSTSGYITVYPTGEPRPTATSVNFRAGNTTGNLVTAALGTSGQVTVYNQAGSVHIAADVVGYYVRGNEGFIPLAMPSAGSLIDGHTAWLDDGVLDFVQYATVMPPDYVAGSPFQAELAWNYLGTPCNVRLGFFEGWVFRPGQVEDDGALGASADTTVAALGTLEVRGTSFTITPVDATALQPGDTLNLSFVRDGTHVADTCTNPMVVVSLTLTY